MEATNALDHFIRTPDGRRAAGTHLVADIKDADAAKLCDPEFISVVLHKCVEACGATLLELTVKVITKTRISGVAVLAESHISIHTNAETNMAFVDAFMCGIANPHACIPIFERELEGTASTMCVYRGVEITSAAAAA